MIYTKLFNLYSDFYFRFYTGKKKQLLTPNKIVYLFALLKEKYKLENKKGCYYAVYYVDDEIFIPYLSSYLEILGIASFYDKAGRAIFKHLDQSDYRFLEEHMNKTEDELKEQILSSTLQVRKEKNFKYHFFQIRGFIFARKQLLDFNSWYKRVLLLIIALLEFGLFVTLILIIIFNRHDESLTMMGVLCILNTPIYIYMYIKWLILPPKKKIKKKRKLKK